MGRVRDGDYLLRGGDGIGQAVTVVTRDGRQSFRAMGGGGLEPLPTDFIRRFEPLTPERRSGLLARFETAFVTDDWLDAGVAVPCVTNGARWNGHAMPLFERWAVDEILVPALSVDGCSTLIHVPAMDAYAEIDICGETPWAFDVEDVRRRAAAGETEFAMTAPDGVEHQAGLRIYQGEDVTLDDGEKRHVYGIGAGVWTWSTTEAPAQPSP